MKWIIYFKGFCKGLLILIAIIIALQIINMLHGNSNYFYNNAFYRIILAFATLLYISYLVTKHKQPKAWIFLLYVISLCVLPFLSGAIELSKSNRTEDPKHK